MPKILIRKFSPQFHLDLRSDLFTKMTAGLPLAPLSLWSSQHWPRTGLPDLILLISHHQLSLL